MKKAKIGVMMLTAMITFSGVSYTTFAESVNKTSLIELSPGEIKKSFLKDIDNLSKGDATSDKVSSLERLKSEIESSSLTRVDQDELIKTINTKIEEINKVIKKEKLPFSEEDIKKKIKIESKGTDYYLSLPLLERYQEYRYELYEGEKLIAKGVPINKIELPKIEKETTFKLDLFIFEDRDELAKISIPVEIKDELIPELEYLYIENSEVVMKFKTDYSLNGDFYYIKDGKKINIKIKDNKFKVKIPSKIELVLKSKFGKEKRIDINIEKDNSVIIGEVSPELSNELREKRIIRLDNYKPIKNLFVGHSGKIINLREEAKVLIEEKYGKVNKEDITFSSEDIEIDDIFGEMNNPGLSTVKINHSFYTNEDLTFYIYVKEDNKVFNTNIDKIEIKGNMVTDRDNFKARDFIDAKEKIEGYTPVLDFIFVIEDGMAYTVDREIDIVKGEINEYKLIDVLRDEEYLINLMYKKEINMKGPISFTDVKGNHWAYHDIKELAFEGVINGYPDGSYKPNNNITIKEFATLLNSTLNTGTNLRVKSFKNSEKIQLPESDWSYLNILSVHKKIEKKDLDKMSFANLNRSITRGEVAFLVDISLELDESTGSVKLSDISNSLYEENIEKLVSSKIISGYSDKTYKPEGKITRAEASVILNKLLKTSKGEMKIE